VAYGAGQNASGGTYDSSPAIYRRVRDYIGPASQRDARIPPREQSQNCHSSKPIWFFFINSTDERPKSLLDFAHQQRLAIFGVKKHIILKPLRRGEKPSRTFPIISPMNPLDASEANATTMELQTLSGLYIHELKDLFNAERFKVWAAVNGQ
jgi:hypothetical protein